jgi:hypothetical protein
MEKDMRFGTTSPNTVQVIKSRRRRGWDMWHAWGRGEVFTGFCLGSPKTRTTGKT